MEEYTDTTENMMNLSDMEPTRLGLPSKDDLTQAVERLARERQPSVNRAAGTFSRPEQYKYDTNLERARQGAGSAARPALSGAQFGDERARRMATAAERFVPKRETPQQIHVHVQGEGLESESQQRQEYTLGGQYDGSDLPARDAPHLPQRQKREGRRTTVSTTPSRGSLGGQFEPLQHPSSVPVAAPGEPHVPPQTRGVKPLSNSAIDISHIQPGDDLGIRRSVNEYIQGNQAKYGTTYRPDVKSNLSNGQFGTAGPQDGPMGEDSAEEAM
jgi:hypothetical protein